ncbi:hypothetical protein JCM11491_004878 [Sporobolomyces phaffii]
MSTDLYQHTLTWKGHGSTVIATGSFDDWKTSLPPLNKQPDGTFSGQIGVPYGQKLVYKYVVDGQWMHSTDEQSETDSSGNVNNTFTVPEKPAVAAPASTEAILPVPESVSTVSGDVSTTEPATTDASVQPAQPTTVESLQQQATDLAGQAQQQATETAGQVQEKTAETVQAAQEKIDEVAPQVKETLSNAAQTTKENAGPAVAAVGGAIAATAVAAAAGLSSLVGSNEPVADKEVPSQSGAITPTRLSAGAPPFVPGGEKPQDPSPTPSPATTREVEESIPTIPSNSFIDAKVPEEDKAHSTSVVPKETAASTEAAPVYDEKTAVVAKDVEPESIATPLGNTAQASSTTDAAPKEEAKKVEAFPEPSHVEGLVAPADHPSDAPLYAAGAAALGAAVAGVTLLGEKAFHAAAPHAQNAGQVVSAQTSKAIDQAPQAASNAYTSAAQSGTHAATAASESASHGYAHAAEVAEQYLEQGRVEAAKALDAVQHTAIGGAVLGTLGFGAAKKEDEVKSTGIPNKDITPLPVSEAPEGPTVPDQVLTSLPASEGPVASTVTPESSVKAPASSSTAAPLPAPKEPSAPLAVAKDSAPVDAAPVESSQSLRPEPVVAAAAPAAAATPNPVSTPETALPPPVAAQQPPSVTVAQTPAQSLATTTTAPRTRESSTTSTTNPATIKAQLPETPVKPTGQQTPFSTAPSTPANANVAAAAAGNKAAGQEALGQGKAQPPAAASASPASAVVEQSSAGKKKEGRRASGFFSRLFGGDKKKDQN